ncbi:MAG: flavodoxin family protein [Promethearchaeia archaeon]
MNYLVVFYTRTGNTREVANSITERLDANIEELMDMKKRKGFIGWFRSGYDAFREKTTDLRVTQEKPEEYDVIILGTPVWAGKMTPALRTYILDKKENFKKVAFFCTEGGPGAEDLFASLENLCGKSPIATEEILAKEVKKGIYVEKVKEFVQEIQESTQ